MKKAGSEKDWAADNVPASASAKKDLATTKKELAAELDDYEKLEPSCKEAGVSHEELVAHCKDEHRVRRRP